MKSLRSKIFLLTLVLIIPTIAILLMCYGLFVSTYESQLKTSSQQTLKPYAKEIELSLQNMKYYVANKTITPDIFNEYSMAYSSDDELERVTGIQALNRDFVSDLAMYPHIQSVFIGSKENMTFVKNSLCDYQRQKDIFERVKRYMVETPSGDYFKQGFIPLDVYGEYVLVIIDQYEDQYIGCWASISAVLDKLDSTKIAGLHSLMLMDHKWQFMSDTYPSLGDLYNDKVMESFIPIVEEFETLPYSLVALLDKSEVLGPLNPIQTTFLLFFVFLFVILAVCIFYLVTKIIRPINNLVLSIDSVRGGVFENIDTDTRLDNEIQKAYDALNALINEIDSLKIKVYEEQLHQKETEIELLQLQIQPHFFLNSLNNILSFARTEEYDLVRKMTIGLAKHFQYLLNNRTLITAAEEVEHTENYLQIQGLRFDKRFTYTIECDEALSDESLPILTLQTFAENALKYAKGSSQPLHIQISLQRHQAQDEALMRITVEDTGDGFDEDTLATLNSGIQKMDANRKCIGIYNIQQRLRNLYGDTCALSFSNHPSGGAHIEMLLPITRPAEEK